jgi:hypothetical protein
MNDDMPPLPDPAGDFRDSFYESAYSADQMRAYARAAIAAAAPAQPAERKPIEGDWRTGAIAYLRAAAEDRSRKYAGAPDMQRCVDTIYRLASELEMAQEAMPYGLDCVAAPAHPAEPVWPTSVQPDGSVWPTNPDDIEPEPQPLTERVAELEAALRVYLNEYEGVYDSMSNAGFRFQSESAKRAEENARAVLAAQGKKP